MTTTLFSHLCTEMRAMAEAVSCVLRLWGLLTGFFPAEHYFCWAYAICWGSSHLGFSNPRTLESKICCHQQVNQGWTGSTDACGLATLHLTMAKRMRSQLNSSHMCQGKETVWSPIIPSHATSCHTTFLLALTSHEHGTDESLNSAVISAFRSGICLLCGWSQFSYCTDSIPWPHRYR